MSGGVKPSYQTYAKNVHPGAGQHLGFQSGRGYYAASGSPGPGKTASRPAPKGDPLRALVNQLLSAQTKPLTTAEQQRQADVERRQGEINSTRNQLIQYLGSAIQPASQAYDSAISQTDQLGKNAAALLGAANPSAQDSSLLRQIGAPQSQIDQLAAANQARFGGQGGVLYTQGAGIPGQSLAAGKAANASYLASLPATASLQAGQGLQALGHSSDLAHQDYLGKLAQIQGTYPQLYQQFKTQQQDDQRKQQALALNQAVAQQSLGIRQANLGLSAARVKNQSAQFNARQGQQNAQFNARQTQAQKNADRSYDLSLKRLGISNANLRLSALRLQNQLNGRGGGKAKGGKGKSFTPSQVGKLKGTAATLAQNAKQGFQTVDNNNVATNHPPIDYQAAIVEGLKEGIPLSILLPALNRYWQPGQGGRPILSIYDRQNLARGGRGGNRKPRG